MTETRKPFDPNQSPLDRIAEIQDEHPSREHSGAVALYLQERWEHLDRLQKGDELQAASHFVSVQWPVVDLTEHKGAVGSVGDVPAHARPPGNYFTPLHTDDTPSMTRDLRHDLICALEQCRRREQLSYLLLRELGAERLSPELHELIRQCAEYHPNHIERRIAKLQADARRAPRRSFSTDADTPHDDD